MLSGGTRWRHHGLRLGLGRQRPPDRCKRRMNSHIVNCLEPQPGSLANLSPHAHASSGWGEAPLSIHAATPCHFDSSVSRRSMDASSRALKRGKPVSSST